jgi:hypothetical protein
MLTNRLCVLTLFVSAALALGACGDDDNKPSAPEYAPAVDPARFVAAVDNPYLPLHPGSRWHYEGGDAEGNEVIDVAVTDNRIDVMGISAVVVRDTVRTPDGELVEDTLDYYAQDDDGNVWYLGEDTKEYEDGKVSSTEGSWRAGVDGAQPGIVMPAAPAVGDPYRQEFYRGHAQDTAQVVRIGARERVPAGSYDDLVVIREWNPLEPKVEEEKYYARGVGVVLETVVKGGEGRIELTRFDAG